MAKRIAWVSPRDGNQDVYTTDLEGKDVKRLTNNPTDNNPSWSPDGKRIAFCSGRSGHLQIYVMDADGGNVRRLTNHDGIDYWPVWSPDGKRIAFTSNRDGNYEIYIMDADGGNEYNLTHARPKTISQRGRRTVRGSLLSPIATAVRMFMLWRRSDSPRP